MLSGTCPLVPSVGRVEVFLVFCFSKVNFEVTGEEVGTAGVLDLGLVHVTWS